MEALHQAHVLTQIGLNFVAGQNRLQERSAKGHRHQLIQRKKADGGEVALATFLRLEFQDGKRKAAAQDYHGSGRAHVHQLDYVSRGDRRNDLQALQLHRCVEASLDNANLRRLAEASQLDRSGKTPWPVYEGQSAWDPTTAQYRLHHSAKDHALGVRGFYASVLEVTKCHQDVQAGPVAASLRLFALDR